MLRSAVGGERVVVAEGHTLRELLGDLEARHHGFAAQVLDPATREPRPFVNIYVNDEDVRYLRGLETPVEDGDVVSILPAVAGGGRWARQRW
jgi:molybdopterin converting factor small subunit